MDPRFLQASGIQVYSGSELLLKGALEAGAGLLTGYPGSPVADFFNVGKAAQEILETKGVVFEIANNEALAVARLNGSQMADIRGMAVMKSVGGHVASDGLALGNLAKTGHKGGALAVIGDDPWNDSTQVPSDSRFLSRHLSIPILEPATFQEIKDWIKIGFDISKRSNFYITYLVTTNLADGGGTVKVHANNYPAINTKDQIELNTATIPVDQTVILPPRTTQQEITFPERRNLLHLATREFGIDQILYLPKSGKAEIGFITSGIAYSYLEHALHELNLSGAFPILKYGLTYPIDPKVLDQFAASVKQIVVVEEKRSFLESQVAELLREKYQQESKDFIPVWGKKFPKDQPGFPEAEGLNPSLTLERLAVLLPSFKELKPILVHSSLEAEVNLVRETNSADMKLPVRTPTYCPGCPHRDSSSVLLDIKKQFRDPAYMKKHHGTKPTDLVFHGDTGCYTMMMYEPNKELMHNYSGMGLGSGTGAGIDPFIRNKQVVFMGDSTFFHSGMIAISDAIKNNQDITIIILDNDTTAMTGHQPTPGTSTDLFGHETFKQRIDDVVKGMAHGSAIPVVRVNPAYRTTYRELLEKTILMDGVKVIIADKECGITYHRKVAREEAKIAKAQGFLPEKSYINVTPEVCEYCLECTVSTGCPGLTIIPTDFGPKITTDLTHCVSDMACTKIKACPSFEEVIVKRVSAPSVIELPAWEGELPRVPRLDFEERWTAYLAGIGGMGIGLMTSILVRAGMKEGYQVLFSDKKGLAIRNGGVYSHLSYLKKETQQSPLIPYGKADLILGLDVLETVRGIDPKAHQQVASKEWTHAVINTETAPTVRALVGIDSYDVEDMVRKLKARVRQDSFFAEDVGVIGEKYLRSKLYTNLMLLGVGYQKGLVPLSLESIRWALQESVKKDALAQNMKAFEIGRRMVIEPALFYGEKHQTYQEALEEKSRYFTFSWGGAKRAAGYRQLVEEALSFVKLDDGWKRQFAIRVYDLINYENAAYAKKYAETVKAIFRQDKTEWNLEATKAVILYLHKVMAIKDEVYVAHLLLAPEKFKRDLERYQIDPKRGDKVIYKHINRPEFNIWGLSIAFDIHTRNWMLAIMKHLKFLRALLPQWHAREKDFRRWYQELVKNFRYEDHRTYLGFVEALRCPEEVRGYREVRYPKMQAAQARVREILEKNFPAHSKEIYPESAFPAISLKSNKS